MSSIGRRSCEKIMKEKLPLLQKLCASRCLISRPPNLILRSQNQVQNILVRNYFFLKNHITLEGAVSHNVLYNQQLSIADYQVHFYGNNYFEWLTIASSVFKHSINNTV